MTGTWTVVAAIAIVFAALLTAALVARRSKHARNRSRDERNSAERAVQTERLIEGVRRQQEAVEVAQREGRVRGNDGR